MKQTAEQIIAAEVDLQDRLWGPVSERHHATGGECQMAAIAQLVGLEAKQAEEESEPFGPHSYAAEYHFPSSWSGFRDYGSDIANLAVAAAHITQEIRRKLALGESVERTARPAAA